VGTVLEKTRELEELRLNGDDDRRVADLLAPYDIRLHEDWARRRRNRHVIRGVLRIGTLLVSDTIGLVGAYFAALVVRQNVLPDLASRVAPLDLEPYVHLLPPAVAVQLLSLAAFRAYAPGRGRRDYYRVFLAILLGTLILFFGETMYATRLPSRLLFVLAGATVVCSVVSLRWLIDWALIAYRRRNKLGRRALVVGREDQIPRVRSHFEETPEINIRFVKSMSFEEAGAPSRLCTVTDRLSELVLQEDIEVVVVAGDVPDGMARRLLDRCLRAGCQVMLVPSVLQDIPNPVETEVMKGLTALAVMRTRLGFPQLALKRLFDTLASLVGLVFLAPLFGGIGVAIKLGSPGPVFFKQRRLGVGGRLFWIYKFRTMLVDAEDRKDELVQLNQYGDAKFFKIKDDPRITKLGRFLRKTSLDELPQLINVLRGDMSLVGPRPPVPDEVAHYSEHHLQRLSVTPGITGLWQINGRSNILDFEEVVRLDLEYISNWSIWKDLAILARTVPAVFHSSGAE
jgi:exopolysaccharide biosynthesis polyprenyl glycosylphosphotransferase